MDFLAFKTLQSPFGIGKIKNSSILNIMISQTLKNECVEFGGYVKEEEEEL